MKELTLEMKVTGPCPSRRCDEAASSPIFCLAEATTTTTTASASQWKPVCQRNNDS